MNADKNGVVRLVDVVNNLSETEECKNLVAAMKEKQKADPARYNLQFNYKSLQEHLAAETNFYCAMYRFLALNEMRSEWASNAGNYDKSEFVALYEEYHSYVLAAAQHIKAYRAHKKMLQNAVIKQDKRRKRGA